MRTAFPSPDYYGRSATRPPHRRGFSRRLRRPIRATSLRGRASPVSLPALNRLRVDPGLSVPDSGLLLPQTPAATPWPCRRPRPLRGLGAFAEKHGVRPYGPFPSPGSQRPDGSCVGGNGGCVSRRYWPIPHSWSCGDSTSRNSHGYWSLACVPLCPGSCLADGFARPVNLPRRYGSLPFSYGSFEHCRQGDLPATDRLLRRFPRAHLLHTLDAGRARCQQVSL